MQLVWTSPVWSQYIGGIQIGLYSRYILETLEDGLIDGESMEKSGYMHQPANWRGWKILDSMAKGALDLSKIPQMWQLYYDLKDKIQDLLSP